MTMLKVPNLFLLNEMIYTKINLVRGDDDPGKASWNWFKQVYSVSQRINDNVKGAQHNCFNWI